MFYSRIITKTDSEVVSLDEAKAQCNILHSDDDTHIQLLIDSSVELAEHYTNRLFTVGEIEIRGTGKSALALPFGEIQSIKTCTMDSEPIDYDFDIISQKIYMDLDSTQIDKPVHITFDAGYTEVPKMVKMGVLLMISTFYEHREDIVTGLQVANIPVGSLHVLDAVKIEVI